MGSQKVQKRRPAGVEDGLLEPGEPQAGGWPGWARGLVSAALIFHLAAILGAVVGGGLPASELELAWSARFRPYYHLIDQGYPYRYYAPEPPPTPVVEARLRFADGRPVEVVRIPDRKARPLLRYQRQLALAYHLENDFREAEGATGDGSLSHLARSYARHLCKTHAGCTGVTLYVRAHLIPPLEPARRAMTEPGGGRFDADAEEFYDTPQRIGDYPCDAS